MRLTARAMGGDAAGGIGRYGTFKAPRFPVWPLVIGYGAFWMWIFTMAKDVGPYMGFFHHRHAFDDEPPSEEYIKFHEEAWRNAPPEEVEGATRKMEVAKRGSTQLVTARG